MRRYIDADVIIQEAHRQGKTIVSVAFIEDMPTADVVEVVRCKDCRYWRDNDHTCKYSFTSPMCANEFCSRGERTDT